MAYAFTQFVVIIIADFFQIRGYSLFGQFINNRLVSIDEITDEHPDNKRPHKIDRLYIKVNYKTIKNPEQKNYKK